MIENIVSKLDHQIRNLISVPDSIYKKIYWPTLIRGAEFYQTLLNNKNSESNEKNENNENYKNIDPERFFKKQLKICIASLRLRQGLLLPENASAETIAKEEPRWTFAIFSASFLYDSLGLFKDIRAETIIVPTAIDWLKQNKKLFLMWSQAIAPKKDLQERNPIIDIIEKANKFIEPDFGKAVNVRLQSLSPESQIPNASISDADNAGNNGGIEEEINENVDSNLNEINKTNEVNKALLNTLLNYLHEEGSGSEYNCLRVSDGLFVFRKTLEDFIAIKNKLKALDEFIDEIKFSLKDEANQYFIRYRPKAFEDRRILEGVLIREENLTHNWKQQVINTEFQPAIRL